MENRRRLTKEVMTQLPVGATLPISSENAAELDAATSNAHRIKYTHQRAGGGVYRIRRSAKTMTATVTVMQGGHGKI